VGKDRNGFDEIMGVYGFGDIMKILEFCHSKGGRYQTHCLRRRMRRE